VSIRRGLLCALASAFFLAPVFTPAPAQAQDFGILESAETIDKGNFKLRLSPLLVFGKDAEDDEPAIAVLAGYGITRRFDVEGGAAFFDGVTFWGANAEAWLIRENPLDVSVAAGFHRRTGDRTINLTGIDLTFLVSGHVTPRVELYGGLDLAFEGVGDDDIDYKTMHFVPGLEVRLAENLDLVAEVGLALNDNARHYIGGGLAFYIR
jgi:hypothetical protein